MADVMISYREPETGQGGDKSVFVLQAALEARGFSVFVGEAAIQGGEEWPETIAAGVHNCSAFVVLCSPTYGDTVWTKRELVMADNLRKPLIPVWHSGPYPPKAVEIFLGGKQRIPGGNFSDGYVAAKIAHSAVAEELIAALLRAGIVPGAPGTDAAAAAKADSGKAVVGAAVDELAAWLTTACDFKAEELAGALPQLEAHGVTVRVDLKYVDEDVLRELQLKPLTIKKLRAGLATLVTGSGTPTSPASPAASAASAPTMFLEEKDLTDSGLGRIEAKRFVAAAVKLGATQRISDVVMEAAAPVTEDPKRVQEKAAELARLAAAKTAEAEAQQQRAREEAARQAEAARIARLQLYGLREKAIGDSGDGNCQFRALADQLWRDPNRHAEAR
jgi:hypothetical protein